MCDLKNIDNVAVPRNEVGNWSRSYRKVDTPYIPMHFKVMLCDTSFGGSRNSARCGKNVHSISSISLIYQSNTSTVQAWSFNF